VRAAPRADSRSGPIPETRPVLPVLFSPAPSRSLPCTTWKPGLRFALSNQGCGRLRAECLGKAWRRQLDTQRVGRRSAVGRQPGRCLKTTPEQRLGSERLSWEDSVVNELMITAERSPRRHKDVTNRVALRVGYPSIVRPGLTPSCRHDAP